MVAMLSAPVPARLVRLELKNCGRGFGSKAAEALGPECPRLTTLKLHGCYRLYDDDVLGMLRRSPELASLALEHAAEITEKSIEVSLRCSAGRQWPSLFCLNSQQQQQQQQQQQPQQ
jgi:hypothetical protein